MVDEQPSDAGISVTTPTEYIVCEQCGTTNELRKKVRSRRFCNNRCRNLWHLAKRRQTEARALEAVNVLLDCIDKLAKQGGR